MKTINIEGEEYDVCGDIFTTTDNKYDVFRVGDRYSYVEVKSNNEDFSDSQKRMAIKSYIIGILVLIVLFGGIVIFAIDKLK